MGVEWGKNAPKEQASTPRVRMLSVCNGVRGRVPPMTRERKNCYERLGRQTAAGASEGGSSGPRQTPLAMHAGVEKRVREKRGRKATCTSPRRLTQQRVKAEGTLGQAKQDNSKASTRRHAGTRSSMRRYSRSHDVTGEEREAGVGRNSKRRQADYACEKSRCADAGGEQVRTT